MAKTNRDIKYINRDFESFRSRLIEFSQTYFPSTYNDFSSTSPGMMFMEQSSYVGDVLSFYLDNQFQETFIQYAQQTNNVFELAYMFGYRPKTTGVAQTSVDFYQQLPSINDGTGNYVPDYSYAITINENTTITSQNGSSFITQDKIDFSVSSSLDPTEVSVYQISGNIPQYFLLKKSRNAISSTINTTSFSFGSPQQFATINIQANNIIKILDVTDSDGNVWYEVDHLGQEMVFDSIKNTNINDPNKIDDTPFLLKLKKVARRFATRFTSLSNLQIQFGAGSPSDTTEEITPNPNNVGIGLPFQKDKLTTAFSPLNFLYTGTYGISPANTTLTVRYLTGGGVNSNITANSLTNLNTGNTKFNNFNLNSTTANDYLVRALSMPSEYGAVSKAYIEQPKLTDNQVSTIETLSLYVLSLNSSGQLDYANTTLKNNLRTYLSQYRMIGDNIEIRDAYIINIGVNFEIIVLPEYNNNEVLLSCISSIQSYFLIDK